MTTAFLRRLTLTVTLATLGVACGGDGGDGPTGSGVGTVRGTIVAADGETPLPGAIVQLSNRPANGPVDTTDALGEYALTNVPTGSRELLATRGSFESRFTVQVRANETVTAAPAEVVPTKRLGYVPGSYDAIEHIVRDSLGFAMTELSPEDLGSASTLDQYGMIFVNCGAGASGQLTSEQLTALRSWISSGGVLYASDLELDFVQELFPQNILSTLYGDEQDLTASVTSEALRAFIGKSTAALRYDFSSWTTPDQVSAGTQVLLRGTFTEDTETHTNKPLAIAIPHGEGKVVFTSFHNEQGVTIDQLAVLRYFVFIE